MVGLTLPAAVEPPDTDFRIPVDTDLQAPSNVGATVPGVAIPVPIVPPDTAVRVPVEVDLRVVLDVGAVAAGLTLPTAVEAPDAEFRIPVDLRLPADIDLRASAAERVQGATSRTVHQSISIGPIYVHAPAGADVDALVDELERRLADSLRRAADEAALAEDDLT